jgi:uncharacterized protein (TIGR02145 family)
MKKESISKNRANLNTGRNSKNGMFALSGLLLSVIMTLAFVSCEKDDTDPNSSNNQGIGKPTATTDPSVVINGVRWATRNVDEFGTFAEKEEDYGKFYQWNRKKSVPTTGLITDWDGSTPAGDTWEKDNDPSPAGWRVPTKDELEKLELAETNVIHEYRVQNGIKGILFIDKDTGSRMFMPYAGFRESRSESSKGEGGDSSGRYWSSHTSNYERATSLHMVNIPRDMLTRDTIIASANLINDYRYPAYSIRPVKE